MSSFLRKIINTPPPEAREETVEFKDPETGEPERVLLRAYEDAENIVSNLAMDEGHMQALATSYSASLSLRGVKDIRIAPTMVPFIKMVHSCLVTPEGEEPLDESDIAYLAKRHGGIFMLLMNAAGRLTNVADIAEQFMDAQVGKSPEGSVPPRSGSGSGASRPRAKSQRR